MQICKADFTKFMQNGTKKATSRLLKYSLFYAAELSAITIQLLFRTQFACKGTTFF